MFLLSTIYNETQNESKSLRLPTKKEEITHHRKVLGENSKSEELSSPKLKNSFKVQLQQNVSAETSGKFHHIDSDSSFSKDLGDEKENFPAPCAKKMRYKKNKVAANVKEDIHHNTRDIEKGPLRNYSKPEFKREKEHQLLNVLDSNIAECKQRKNTTNVKNATQKDIKTSTSLLKNGNLTTSNTDSLSHELKDMILKQKSKKIRRPPNAFMLFAKEKRRQIQGENAGMSNKTVSARLGKMWKDLPSEEMTKYYQQAKALEKFHKETFPDYSYSPFLARKNKEQKSSRKKISENAVTNAVKAKKSLIFNATEQADKNVVSENHKEEEKANFRGCAFLPYSGLMYDSQFYPQSNTSHLPSREGCCNPFCTKQIHKCRNYNSTNINPYHSSMENFGPPNVTSSTNPCNCSGTFAHPFYPSYWRPWMMWPSGCCHPLSRPVPKEFLDHWMQPSAFPATNPRPLTDVHENQEQEKGLKNVIRVAPRDEETVHQPPRSSTNQCPSRNDGELNDNKENLISNNNLDDSDDENRLIIVDDLSDEEITVD
ncbi:uncharacterized protein [Parasteatoda tepidariorum]|uniref:uncharacterized protein isoform X2 n=1 Tax=Parasteatoda tepidariorum TaxID=114398 RepID=UPI0039BC9B38